MSDGPDAAVVVAPGFALDCSGNEIIVEAPVRIDLNVCAGGRCFVTIQYTETVVLRKLKEEVGPSVGLKSGPFFRQRFRTGCQRTAPGRPDLPLLPT